MMIRLINIFYLKISQNNRTLLLLLLASLFLSSCTQDYSPIEADDFGYPKMTIYAKGKNVTGEEENQLSDWVSSGYKYNGDKMTLMVYNKQGSNPTKYIWNPWLCGQEDSICITVYDSPKCEIPEYCTNPQDRYETINNAPCYLEKGEGLYLLITDPLNTEVTDPNTYDSVNRLPSSAGFYTKSLWDKTTMWQNQDEANGYSGELIPNSTIDSETGEETASTKSKESYIDGEAYFKILDRYYEDNSGHLHVVLKRGFDQVVSPPIATVITFITEIMNDTSEDLYKQIIVDSEYRLSLKILLVLYIIVHGILLIGGASEMSQKEFVSMFIKLTIVIQLITGEDSWKLFNDYFFRFFTEGLDEMVGIVTADLNGSGNGMTFFDNLLGLLFSYETSVKIYALMWSFPSGFVAAFIVYAAFALFAVGIAKAVMLYLLAYMAISLLIIVAPIFICFMLFESTKPLFEGWIRQFVIFFMQTIMVLAALNLMAQMIVDQIYMILGFKACQENWIDVYGFVIAKSWFICDFFNQMDTIEVPGYGYNDASNPDYFCEPFECMDERYVELPFLDPSIKNEADLIEDFKSPQSSLSIPMLYNSSVLLLMCYLMMKFNDVVPQLAKSMAGGSATGNALGQTASSVTQDFKSGLAGIKNFAGKLATGKSQSERELGRRQRTVRGNLRALEGQLTIKDSKSKLASAWNAMVAAPGQIYDTSGAISNVILPPSIRKIIYKTSGFVKDMVLPTGSLMLGTPEERKRQAAELKNAKAGLRGMDAQEGYGYDKSYREQIGDYFEKKTGIAEIKRRAAEFDNTYYDSNGKFLFSAAGKGVAKRIGQIAYNTKAGKAVYDGVARLSNAIVDEYKAVFTEQGKIDRINNQKIDNRISALATQYKLENPLRDRNDRLASSELDKYSNALNLDKNELLLMDGMDQKNYIDRAYAALPEHKRNAEVNRIYNSLNDNIAANGAITRSTRDMDPNVLINESLYGLDIDKEKFEKLNGKDKLVALEKSLRTTNLEGNIGTEAYRAYVYLKQKAQAQQEIEKFAAEEAERKQTVVYRTGEAIEKIGNAPKDLYNSVVNMPKNIKSYMDRKGIKIDLKNLRFSFRVARLEGAPMTDREKQLFNHAIKYNKEAQARIQIDNNNVDQVLKEAAFALGINEATIQSISPERRLGYIERAINNNIHLDANQDFQAYRGYRALKEIIEQDLVRDPIVIAAERAVASVAQKEKERVDKIASYEE